MNSPRLPLILLLLQPTTLPFNCPGGEIVYLSKVRMVANNKNAKFAVAFTCIGFLFVLTALSAPYWLQNDGKLQNPKFTNIGKWPRSLKVWSVVLGLIP